MALEALDWAVVSLVGLAVLYYVRKRVGSLTEAPTTQQKGAAAVVPAATSGKESTVNERNIVEKMKKSDKSCVIFFGSQTGTAEEYSGRLMKDARRFSFHAMTADLKDYDPESLADMNKIENSLVVFCLATYGEGEPTDNAREFYDWLKAAEESKSIDLSGLSYTVFGLGNKTYEQFNFVARSVDGILQKLGARRAFERGEGDDDANLEEDFVNWKDRMWSAICVTYNVQAGDDASFRQYAIQYDAVDSERVFTGEVATLKSLTVQKRPFNLQNPYLATILASRELYRDDTRSCRHIEFDITNSGVRYATGDHVAVYPRNRETLVQRLATRLKIDLNQVFSLVSLDETAKKRHPFPCPTTFGTALRSYVDIGGKPSSFLLRELVMFTTDPTEKAFLQKLVSSHDEFAEWVTHSERNIVDVLDDIPSAAPPIDYLLELLPRLQPRYYSISSSPKASPNAIHITSALVRNSTKAGRTFEGVCTSFLSEMQPGERVPIFVRQSNFRLPQDTRVPVIMVGPGTGLAPFRAFVQERTHFKTAGKNLGDTMLFFGCQKRAQHFLYEDELVAAKEGGVLSHLSVACSRDQAEKVYVQHHIRDHGEHIAQLLSKGAYVYVCGDAKHMARDVHEMLEQVYAKYNQRTATEAVDFFKQLRTKRRYQVDVW